MNIEKKLIQNNYRVGRNTTTAPKSVVVHTYNGVGRSLYNWFNNPSAQCSAHYAIFKDGNGEQYVEDMDTAWHAGNSQVNWDSIGIEHQDDGNPFDSVRTDEQYESSAQLIASLYIKYGWDIENMALIMPHSSYTSTGCPGALDFYRIRNRVYEILHPVTWRDGFVPLTETNKPDMVASMYNILDGSKIRDYMLGTEFTTHWIKNDWALTDYSYTNNIPNGFKMSELRYRTPEPEKPVEPEVPEVPTEPVKPTVDIDIVVIKPKFNLFIFIGELISKLISKK